MDDKVRREGLLNYLDRMQKLLKFKEDKMFENHSEDITGFGVMNNEAVQINSQNKFADPASENYQVENRLF